MASGWEFSPDGLQLTLKLRPRVVFDIVKRVIGSGPWQLADYQPSVGLTWKRNQGYYDKSLPYIDQVNTPVLSEYASGLAQFQAGHVYAFAVKQEDVLQTKKSLPRLNMYLDDVAAPSLLS